MVPGFIDHHHDIVRRLVIDQQLTRTVSNDATSRVFYFPEEGIGVGTFLIVVAGDLEHEEPDDIDDHDQRGHPSYHIASVVQFVVLHLFAIGNLKGENQRQRDDCAAYDAHQPMQPVEEAEHLQRMEHQRIEKHQYDDIVGVLERADGTE